MICVCTAAVDMPLFLCMRLAGGRLKSESFQTACGHRLGLGNRIMIGRILRIAFLAALVVLVVHRLFNRRQKRALRETAVIGAWVLLAASLLAAAWYAWGGE